jgi:hypothetical protein
MDAEQLILPIPEILEAERKRKFAERQRYIEERVEQMRAGRDFVRRKCSY